MSIRKRVFNLAFIGDRHQQEKVIKTLMERNLQEKLKVERKLAATPHSYVINNLSNGVKPVMSLIRTPGSLRYTKNILTGCMIADYTVLVLTLTPAVLDNPIAALKAQMKYFKMCEFLRVLQKPVSLIILHEVDGTAGEAQGRKLTKEELDVLKSELKAHIEQSGVLQAFNMLYYPSSYSTMVLENFVLQEILTEKEIVKPDSRDSNGIFTSPMALEGGSENLLAKKKGKLAVLKAYKNYETNRLILISKVISGSLEPYSLTKYKISNNFDKFFRFEDIEIGWKRVAKAVAGELVSLSFVDPSTYPFFLKKAIVYEGDQDWDDCFEKGVVMADVRVHLFKGGARNIQEGTRFTIHYCMVNTGVQVQEVLEVINEEVVLLKLNLRNNLIQESLNCLTLGHFAVMQGRDLVGYGDVTKVYIP